MEGNNMTKEELKQFATAIARGERVDINIFSKLTKEEEAEACELIKTESEKFVAEIEEKRRLYEQKALREKEEWAKEKEEWAKEKEEWARYWMEESAMERAYTHVRNKQFLFN